ncbi:MAG: GFA family protein [Alphaproteobacteria bacterium]|nr:GFA family protein [Alphaproteobacteria bacterium]
MPDQPALTGGCLCGAVRYELARRPKGVVNCHCGMCRRWHGSHGAYVAVRREAFRITKDEGLTWYASSPDARRGFCKICGSSLFWDKPDNPAADIAAGTLDQPTGLTTLMHIFVDDKADYTNLTDGIAQRHQSTE